MGNRLCLHPCSTPIGLPWRLVCHWNPFCRKRGDSDAKGNGNIPGRLDMELVLRYGNCLWYRCWCQTHTRDFSGKRRCTPEFMLLERLMLNWNKDYHMVPTELTDLGRMEINQTGIWQDWKWGRRMALELQRGTCNMWQKEYGLTIKAGLLVNLNIVPKRTTIGWEKVGVVSTAALTYLERKS